MLATEFGLFSCAMNELLSDKQRLIHFFLSSRSVEKRLNTKSGVIIFKTEPFFKFLRLNEFLIPADYFFLISELFLFLQFITKKSFKFLRKVFNIKKGSLSNGNSTTVEAWTSPAWQLLPCSCSAAHDLNSWFDSSCLIISI